VVWGWNKLNKAKAMDAEKHLKEQENLYLRTVESLALAVDAKDQTTYGHIRRVRAFAVGLAKLCGIRDQNELMAIETGSLLHDIGKLAIEDYILNKPGRLTKQEFEKMKMHAAAGDEILKQVRFPFPVAKYVRSHHERWDGTGYPDGLKAEEIPLGARILAIADAFDAIRFSRPYKLSYGIGESVEILRAQAGIVYDPKLVQLFADHVHELEEAASKESENAPELAFRKYFEKVDRALSAASNSSHPVLPDEYPAELVQLAEFCELTGRYLEIADLIPILARRLQRIVPFSTCVFYLDDGNEHITAAYAIGEFSDVLQNHSMGFGKGISGWVAAHRRPMINTSPVLDFQGLEGDFSTFSDALVAPVVCDEHSLGTISLYARSSITYNQDHLGLIQAAASLFAPTIADARRQRTSQENDGLIDPATETYRVFYLAAVGPQMITFAERNSSPLSLLFWEIRNFSEVINLYGVSAGTSVLRKVADTLKPELREIDILVRYGHHGFVALLPGVRAEQALRYCQRLQQGIRKMSFSADIGQNFALECRFGVSSYPNDGTTVFALLQSAQESLPLSCPETGIAGSNIFGFPPRV